jgi:hypothetical protein
MADESQEPGDQAHDRSGEPAESGVARSRRSFLGAAAAALGAVAVQSVAAMTPVEASTGSTVKAGQQATASAVTTFRNTASGATALKGYASSTSSSTASNGVVGQSKAPSGTGVQGIANESGGTGVIGKGSSRGVYGVASASGGTGVWGVANTGSGAWGVGGISASGHGIHGESAGAKGTGVYGTALGSLGFGIRGFGPVGVQGNASIPGGYGVDGEATAAGAVGVFGAATGSNGVGVYGYASGSAQSAGVFWGEVAVVGTLSKSAGSFRIDHPLDPENRYLSHSFVESPEMLNVYSGSVRLNGKGKATIRLPRYFEALNMEHRYQLTAIGAPAPDLHVARRVEGNRFLIAGGPPGAEVCWQVTGVRQDAYARKHRIKVDTAKKGKDKGRFLNPDAFGKRRTAGIGYRRASKVRG